MRALDQAGNIGEHEFAPVAADHAELRLQRRERIVGDLRLGGAHRGEECRFSGIRQPDEAGIGDQLEPQPDRAFFAGCPGLARRGARLVDDLKCALPKPPLPPRASTTRWPSVGEIGEERFAIFFVDLGADRHLEHGVGAVGAMAVLAHAGAAVLCQEMLLVAIVDQRVEAVDRFGDHVAAFAAVAAIRPAELDEFLAPERHAAVAAVAGANIDLGLVEEFHLSNVKTRLAAAAACP